jgi:hypothetical protein
LFLLCGFILFHCFGGALINASLTAADENKALDIASAQFNGLEREMLRCRLAQFPDGDGGLTIPGVLFIDSTYERCARPLALQQDLVLEQYINLQATYNVLADRANDARFSEAVCVSLRSCRQMVTKMACVQQMCSSAVANSTSVCVAAVACGEDDACLGRVCDNGVTEITSLFVFAKLQRILSRDGVRLRLFESVCTSADCSGVVFAEKQRAEAAAETTASVLVTMSIQLQARLLKIVDASVIQKLFANYVLRFAGRHNCSDV